MSTRLPYKLNATDVVRHIVNVDSRFRDDPLSSTATNFYFSLLTPVKNVLRVRVTSIEFPNNYAFFTERRRNVVLRVLYIDGGVAMAVPLWIADGNYCAGDMETTLNAAITAIGVTNATFKALMLTVTFSEITGKFTFTAKSYFALDTTWRGDDGTSGWLRPFDYGLGFYLGFSRRLHKGFSGCTGTWILESDGCANFAGDNYLFLRVNDFNCVRQTVTVYDGSGLPGGKAQNDFNALAKIVLREPKNFMSFDDYASQHAKEVVFPSPVDLGRLSIRVLDPYGEELDLCSAQFSFSIEVLEVRNPLLYNQIRDSLVAAVCGGGAAPICYDGNGLGISGGAAGP
jgi:hypothetical protein